MDEARLKTLRDRIDELDEALADLLERRVATAREIGAAKGEGPVYDPAREERILRGLQARHPSLDPASLGALADRILASFRVPLDYGPQGLVVGVSLGVALHPGDGEKAEELLHVPG